MSIQQRFGNCLFFICFTVGFLCLLPLKSSANQIDVKNPALPRITDVFGKKFPLQIHPKIQNQSDEEDVIEDSTILWQGFHHEWDKTPHRLNRLGSYFRYIEYDAHDQEVYGEHRSTFKVGAYNDTGIVKTTGTFVKSSALGFHHGYIDFNDLKVRENVGKSGSAKHRVAIDLKEIGFDQYDEITVILRGFRIRSTSYDAGYNTRGFAIRVIPVNQFHDEYVFDGKFYVHPEHAPDRPQLDDSCKKDDHCKRYTYKAKIYYTLIGVKNQDGLITEPNKDNGTNAYSQYIKMAPYYFPNEASKNARSAAIYGEPGFDHGLVAIQGFYWHLDSWKKTKKDGRYIRDIEFNISHIDYNKHSGEANFLTNMYFTNTGMWPYGYDVNFKMWNTLIQFNDPHFDKSKKTWLKGSIYKGDYDFVEEVGYEFD